MTRILVVLGLGVAAAAGPTGVAVSGPPPGSAELLAGEGGHRRPAGRAQDSVFDDRLAGTAGDLNDDQELPQPELPPATAALAGGWAARPPAVPGSLAAHSPLLLDAPKTGPPPPLPR